MIFVTSTERTQINLGKFAYYKPLFFLIFIKKNLLSRKDWLGLWSFHFKWLFDSTEYGKD